MSNGDTVATLFELAIATEKEAQVFYLGLVKKFSHVSEVSDFWRGMLEDEKQHAQELENLRDSLTPDQLRAPADDRILQAAKNNLRVSIEDTLKRISTLDDAYEFAHELEYSEVNVVFKFLATKFGSSEEWETFIVSQIEDHAKKIMEFSETFGDREWRKGIVIRNS